MSNTANLVAHATHNENNATRDGFLGDQSGTELQLCRWYQRGWTAIYRPVDPEVAEAIAQFMEKAVSNGFIGYDGYYRNGLYRAVFEDGKEVGEVDTSVCCDCSSLVYCAVRKATGVVFVDNLEEDSGDYTCPLVRHYPDYIENQCAGVFEKLEGSDYTDSAVNLKRGDIMYAEGAHTAVWV